jgi:hypothetical protein
MSRAFGVPEPDGLKPDRSEDVVGIPEKGFGKSTGLHPF